MRKSTVFLLEFLYLGNFVVGIYWQLVIFYINTPHPHLDPPESLRELEVCSNWDVKSSRVTSYIHIGCCCNRLPLLPQYFMPCEKRGCFLDFEWNSILNSYGNSISNVIYRYIVVCRYLMWIELLFCIVSAYKIGSN